MALPVRHRGHPGGNRRWPRLAAAIGGGIRGMPIEVRSLAEWEAAGIAGMLSVVIPAHNEEGHIAETVQGLVAAFREAGITYEILVINDNSTDSTERILATLNADD